MERPRRLHPALLLTSTPASSRASAWLGRTAPALNFTSTTRADRLSTTFLLRMGAGVGRRVGGEGGQELPGRYGGPGIKSPTVGVAGLGTFASTRPRLNCT